MEERQSINTLVNELVELQLGKNAEPTVAQPKLSRSQKKTRLRKVCWNVLFSTLNGPHRIKKVYPSKQSSLTEVDQIYALAFEMRQDRKYDRANRLEELFAEISKGGIDGTLRSILRLMALLADVHVPTTQAVVGHGSMHLPVVFPRSTLPRVLPEGPLCYGDTNLQRKDDPYFTHFPREIFEVPGISIDELGVTKYNILHTSMFKALPGSNLSGNGVFDLKGNLEDNYEEGMKKSLFGALTFSRAHSIDVVLDFPDIKDTWNSHILGLKPAKIHEVSDDEGFVDRTPSSVNSSLCESPSEEFVPDDGSERDIWDLAMEYKPSRHHTWELRGRPPVVFEQPYLTEAGTTAFDMLCCAQRRQLRLVDPSIAIMPLVCVTVIQLVGDALNMLIGVPSTTFLLEQDTFTVAEGIYVKGMSPEGISATLRDLLKCGSYYSRLVKFSRPPLTDSFYHAGLIFQAFIGGVRKYLQFYRGCILSIPKEKTLLQLIALTGKLRDQMGILAHLCHCTENPPPDIPSEDQTFPKGIKLLSYLYARTLEASASAHYPMLLSLLHSSCGPYIMFVRQWVFEGLCHDVYGEFLIQVNDEFLRYRDRHYWTRGYVLLSKNLEDSVPLFLKDLANDIFVCGKSINLLRIVAPQHFLFGLEGETPSVSLTFSEQELTSIEQQSRLYLSRVQEVARQHSTAREDMLKKKEQEKQTLLIKARRKAMERITKYQERTEAIKKEQDSKKRATFAELKEHMEKDLRRRAIEREQEREEDAARVAATARQELLEAAVEDKLAQQAKEELIQEYAEMMSAAALREQRALWRVSRHRLETRRLDFLLEDEGKWQAELAMNPIVQDVGEEELDEAIQAVSADGEGKHRVDSVDSVDPVPPGVSESVQVEIAGTSSLADVRGTTLTSGNQLIEGDLPSWAASGQGDTVVIGEGSGEGASVKESNTAQGTGTSLDEGTVRHVNDTTQELPVRPAVRLNSKMYATKESSTDFEESVLPSWAQRGSKAALPAFGLEAPHKAQIPSWAREKPEDASSQAGGDVGASEESEERHADPGKAAVKTDEEEETSGATRRIKMVSWAASRSRPSLSSLEDASLSVRPHMSAESPSEDSPIPSKWSVRMNPQMAAAKQSDTEQDLIPRRKLVGDKHVSVTSTEIDIKSSIRTTSSMAATTESVEESKAYPSRKVTSGRHISEESKPEEVVCPSIQSSFRTSVTSQSVEEVDPISRKKQVVGSHVGQQSEEVAVYRPHIRFHPGRHASCQSEPVVPRPVRQNVFGHPSQVSMVSNYEFISPMLKKTPDPSPFKDADFACYQVKARPRRNADSIDGQKLQLSSAFHPDRYATKESEHIDHDQLRLAKFKAMNVHGHSSDSSVQKLLYGENFGRGRISRVASLQEEHEDYDIEPWTSIQMEEYNKDFRMLNDIPAVDLTKNVEAGTFSGIGDYGMNSQYDTDASSYISLAAIMKRSVTAPLMAQIQLVNQSLVNYFMSELEIEENFVSLRRFLLMQDGEFGQSLSDQLFEKLATNPLPHEMLNPMYLNGVLSRALRSSIHGDSAHAGLVSFALKYIPTVLNHQAPNALDCLDITYRVNWPVNTVITSSALTRYSRVFSFMLQLKRAVWVLKDVWHRLKRDALIHHASGSAQFRTLQLYRHQMQHFVKVMQGYIANQIIYVTWQEFQQDLANKVRSLDDLHRCHTEYLSKCVFRCLLNKNAASVMKIIEDIFALILRFRSQLISQDWQREKNEWGEEVVTHPDFDELCSIYKGFHDYARFLFRVVRKLAMRGYQPHLQELLLRLNFNSFYQEK